MARSKHYMNWTNVTVSYGVGPTTITLTEVTACEFGSSDSFASFKGDGYVFPTAMARTDASRTCRITGGDIGKLQTIPRNTACTVVAKLNDAANGTSAGCLTYTLSNALFLGLNPSGSQNTYITDSAGFMAYSSDGTTDPLAYSEAT